MLSSGDIVRAVNRDDRPLTIGVGGRSYVLTPDKEIPVPFDAAVIWFGDPRAGDVMKSFRDEAGVVYWIPDRASEVRRLRAKYGIYAGSDLDFDGPGGRIPDVKLFSLDGDPIDFVINDPVGNSVLPAKMNEAERESLMAIVNRQQQQIEMLLQHFNLDEGAVPIPEIRDEPISPIDEPPDPLDIPEDDSTTAHTTSPAAQARPV